MTSSAASAVTLSAAIRVGTAIAEAYPAVQAGLDAAPVPHGDGARITDPAAVGAMAARWASGVRPARVDGAGMALTADSGAPSAGPPPWFVYRLTPRAADAVATVEPGGATRWRV
jgi:hypothetical protein